MKKTREEEHAKKQPKKRGQKLWDTELPVVALVHRTPWARVTNNVKKPQSQMFESCRMLEVTHLILRFVIVQNKLQQTNKTKIKHE